MRTAHKENSMKIKTAIAAALMATFLVAPR